MQEAKAPDTHKEPKSQPLSSAKTQNACIYNRSITTNTQWFASGGHTIGQPFGQQWCKSSTPTRSPQTETIKRKKNRERGKRVL